MFECLGSTLGGSSYTAMVPAVGKSVHTTEHWPLSHQAMDVVFALGLPTPQLLGLLVSI